MSYIVPRDKPKRCTQPKCRFMDRNTLDCRLQGKSWESFEEQYEHCPLIEIHTPPAEPMVDIRDTQYNLPIGTDCISRQAAIDALNEYFVRIGKLKRRGLNKGEKAISLDTVGAIKTLPPAQPVQCEDAVSRQTLKDGFTEMCNLICPYSKKQQHVMCGSCLMGTAFDVLEATPPVTPKQRTGKWIKLDMHRGMADHKCTACEQECYVPTCMGEPLYAFCPNCGADMREVTK